MRKILNIKLIVFIAINLVYLSNSFGQNCDSSGTVDEFLPNKMSGHLDFTIIGASQNPVENNSVTPQDCQSFLPRLTTSDQLVLPAGDNIAAAYLYWSGTGDPISNVQLNNQPINSQRCFTQTRDQLSYFSAYADVTDQVQLTGGGNYTLTGLDNSAIYRQFNCNEQSRNRSTVYGGWAMVVILENAATYGDFTVFYYDGLKLFQNESFNINIQANVFEQFLGSHVGVVTWEGDKDNSIRGDNIQLNGQLLPSDGYDEIDNIFNGTNSFSDPVNNALFNADQDDFDANDVVQQELNTAGANFNFSLRSGQDLILLNNIIFRIPNQAPDAVIEMQDFFNFGCTTDKTFEIDYTYSNLANASRPLPAGTPISFFLNSLGGQRIGQSVTGAALEPGRTASGTATITLPPDFLGNFEIIAYIDDPAEQPNNYGTVLELLEQNNTYTSEALVDQDYIDLPITMDICEGDFILIDGEEVSTVGDFPFNTVTARGGCDSTGIVTVRVNPKFNLPAILMDSCEGDNFVLPSGEIVNLPVNTSRYNFSDSLLTTRGCDSIVNIALLVKAIKRSDILAEICIGESHTLPDGTVVGDSDNYTTTLAGASFNGCDSIISTKVNVLDINFPNAFSPNSDGENDGFKALKPRLCEISVSNFTLKIFNRWGELVFESTNIEEAWDGGFNDELSKTGLYLWHATYDTGFTENIEQSGGVTLLR